jgi:hypothetical protein
VSQSAERPLRGETGVRKTAPRSLRRRKLAAHCSARVEQRQKQLKEQEQVQTVQEDFALVNPAAQWRRCCRCVKRA